MRLPKCVLRILAASAVAVALAGAAPAFAQSATLSVTSFVAPDSISVGGTGDYVATIGNQTAGSIALGVTATMTAPAGFNITGVSSECLTTTPATIPAAGAPVVTCTLASITNGTPGTVTFTVSIPLPDPLPTDPSACPGASTLPASVPAATLVVTATNDAASHPATSAAAAGATTVPPYADLGVDVQGPPTANVGDVVTYTVTVTNNGPCVAQNVAVDNSTASSGLTFQSLNFTSGTGSCTAKFDGCDLGNLQAGQSVVFQSKYKVAPLLPNFQSTNNPYPVGVSSDTSDPNSNNDSATATVLTQSSDSGCSTGGPAGFATVALFLVAGLAIRRRRA